MQFQKVRNTLYFVYRSKRENILAKYINGSGPDHILYGYNFFRADKECSVKFSDVSYSFIGKIVQAIFIPLERIFIHKYGQGFKIGQALLLLDSIRRVQLVITTTDSCGLPILFLKKLGLIKSQVVYVSVGLCSQEKILPGRDKFVIDLMKRADALISYSRDEQKNIGSLTKKNVNYMFPPVDTRFFTGGKSRGYILTVGGDETRDYQTFFEAVKSLHEVVHAVTNPIRTKNLEIPSNTVLHFNISYQELRNYYRHAHIVVIPFKELHRAGGQLVFLEALSCNKPVIISDVSAIRDLKIKAGPYIKYVSASDPVMLRQAITSLLKYCHHSPISKDRNRKKSLQFDSEKYYKHLIRILQSISK